MVHLIVLLSFVLSQLLFACCTVVTGSIDLSSPPSLSIKAFLRPSTFIDQNTGVLYICDAEAARLVAIQLSTNVVLFDRAPLSDLGSQIYVDQQRVVHSYVVRGGEYYFAQYNCSLDLPSCQLVSKVAAVDPLPLSLFPSFTMDALGHYYYVSAANNAVIQMLGSSTSASGSAYIFSLPSGCLIDSPLVVDELLYIYAYDKLHSRLLKFRNEGDLIGYYELHLKQVSMITGMSLDSARNVMYLTDNWNHHLIMLDLASSSIVTLSLMSLGVPHPLSVSFYHDDLSYLYIASENRVVRMNPQDVTEREYLYGNPPQVSLNSPFVLSLNAQHQMYVLNAYSNKVCVFDEGMFIGSFPTMLDTPSGLVVDSENNIYVVGAHHPGVWCISKLDSAGSFLFLFPFLSHDTKGLAVDRQGSLYTLSDTKVTVFTSAGVFMRQFDMHYSTARQVVVDSEDNIYVLFGNNVIQTNSMGEDAHLLPVPYDLINGIYAPLHSKGLFVYGQEKIVWLDATTGDVLMTWKIEGNPLAMSTDNTGAFYITFFDGVRIFRETEYEGELSPSSVLSDDHHLIPASLLPSHQEVNAAHSLRLKSRISPRTACWMCVFWILMLLVVCITIYA
jgi:hypothetical protein